ncbi:phage filamentation protein Fil family protein [Cedecea davisae]|uniref:phage filamentation protein Fil family protein n=1 Tax=Cedecea davisae TaxID=158484 RepID=UPI00376EF95C
MKDTAEVGQLVAGTISTEQLSASCKRSLQQNINSGMRCLTLATLTVQVRILANPVCVSTIDAILSPGSSFFVVLGAVIISFAAQLKRQSPLMSYGHGWILDDNGKR